ncbi:MAG: DNA polymerase III subunit beta [Hyphomicrobiaceae bacterium]|nr:DNA polymerase III subunit beta [Hyphomicrobiaceae bacterium]
MKVILERAHLLKSLARIHRVVERRNTIPILSNVALRADGAGLRLKATDLDLEAVEQVAAMTEDSGATTVPAHMFYDIVRKLPDGAQVKLETRGESALTVEAGRTRFELQALPESDFPDLTAGQFSHAFAIPVSDLKRLIDRTQFAISVEETRYYLNGIFLHAVEEGAPRLRAVATDGHRLAKTEVPAPRGAEGMPGIIVPKKTVGEVQKLLDGAEGEAQIELSSTKIRVSLGEVVLTSKLIDGTFPDYQRVIPQNNDKVMDVDRASFAAAVDRVSTVASERGRAVKMALTSEQLVLSVTNPDSGSATDELVADYDGPALEIGFNSKYLLDITDQLETGTARFLLADPGAPTLIQDADGSDTLYVLMPMRV